MLHAHNMMCMHALECVMRIAKRFHFDVECANNLLKLDEKLLQREHKHDILESIDKNKTKNKNQSQTDIEMKVKPDTNSEEIVEMEMKSNTNSDETAQMKDKDMDSDTDTDMEDATVLLRKRYSQRLMTP